MGPVIAEERGSRQRTKTKTQRADFRPQDPKAGSGRFEKQPTANWLAQVKQQRAIAAAAAARDHAQIPAPTAGRFGFGF